MSTRFTEIVHSPFAGSRVDKSRGIIKGVKLCGTKSANGREYLLSAFRKDIRKYEGVLIHCNHSKKYERDVESVAGRIRNARVDPDGTPRGDAHLLKSHPMYNRIIEAADKDSSLYGFSHVADCHMTSQGGRQVIEGIEKVWSVDLVANPATTRGLFEGAMTMSYKKLIERLTKITLPSGLQKAITKLVEVTADVSDADLTDDSSAEVDHTSSDDDLRASTSACFLSAIAAIAAAYFAGKIDKAQARRKFSHLLNAHDKVNAPADDDDDDDSDLDTDAVDTAGAELAHNDANSHLESRAFPAWTDPMFSKPISETTPAPRRRKTIERRKPAARVAETTASRKIPDWHDAQFGGSAPIKIPDWNDPMFAQN